MKYEITGKIDELRFTIWDTEAETLIEKPAEIEDFLAEKTAKKAIALLHDGIQMFCSDLKEAVKQDLTDCFKRADDR